MFLSMWNYIENKTKKNLALTVRNHFQLRLDNRKSLQEVLGDCKKTSCCLFPGKLAWAEGVIDQTPGTSQNER